MTFARGPKSVCADSQSETGARAGSRSPSLTLRVTAGIVTPDRNQGHMNLPAKRRSVRRWGCCGRGGQVAQAPLDVLRFRDGEEAGAGDSSLAVGFGHEQRFAEEEVAGPVVALRAFD